MTDDINFRERKDILNDLISLIRRPGYIYSLCLILFEDFHLSLESLGEINYSERISVKEAAVILGYLIQDDINFSYPPSLDYLIENKKLTYELLEELHGTFLSSQMEMIQQLLLNYKTREINNPPFSKFEFFTKGRSLQEAIFYAGDSVYDFQYLEYLPFKYRLDEQWLKEHRNFDIQQIICITKSIREIQQDKANKVGLIDLRSPDLVKSIKKIIKGKHKSKTLHDILTQMEFMQFYSLFPPVPDESGLSDSEKDILRNSNWNIFYDNLLDLFVLDSSQLSSLESIDNFLENFSIKPTEHNESFKAIGDYNLINSKPIIQLSKDKWFLPIYYLLTEAVYESPYYWMCEDDKYRSKALHNRGKVGEEIVCNLLKPVFGEDNVFPSVKIKTSKGKTATDIDVLCLLGNKALCVQVKSKKLTMASRRGETDALIKDFKGAFQNAYEQGLKCRDFIESQNCTFIDENGCNLALPDYIKDVYILGVTTENYPAITHNSFVLLEKDESNPNPLFLSVFDLELVAHYLKDPYDFMYYVRQRTSLMDYFTGDEEIVYLGYHLLNRLCRNPKYKNISLKPDFGSAIDRNYYPYKLGLLDKISSETDTIANSWRNAEFERLCDELKSHKNPDVIDIIFALFDISDKSRENLLSCIRVTKQTTRTDRSSHSFAMPLDNHFGISFVSINSMSQEVLENKTICYAHIKKYLSKADSWLGLGSYPFSPNLIDVFYYDSEPWEYNAQDEEICKDFNSHHKTRMFSINGNKKTGRNDLCPCGSGKKYKKCCGRK